MLNKKPKVKIRLTGIGKWLLFLAFFLLFSAQNTGNSLLYLVCSCIFTTLFFSLVETIVSKITLNAELSFPEVICTGQEAEIICKILPNNSFNQYHLRFENSYLEHVKRNNSGYLKNNILLEKAGKYTFKNFSVIKLGMLGIFYNQLVFPEFMIYAVDNFNSNGFGIATTNKGPNELIQRNSSRNGEFWSQELYHEGEDTSKINWIVSARSMNEWIIVRSDSELDREIALKTENQESNSAAGELSFEHYDIFGKNFSDYRKEALKKNLNPLIYRLLSLIELLVCVGVYSTGFLQNSLPWIFTVIILLGLKGNAFAVKYHKAIYYSCLIVASYILLKSLSPKAPINIVLLLEFSLLILILQLMTMNNIRSTLAGLTLMFMIILGIAAMNVNFAFPAIFLPFLILAAMTLSFLRYNTISSVKNTENKLSLSSRGLKGTILLIIVFILLWVPFFYLIPRTTSYGIASELANSRSRGYSGATMDLNGSGFLEDNQTVVMRIKPNEEKTVSTSILRRLRQKLIRGGAFSEYEDGEWKKTRRGLFVRDLQKSTGELVLDHNFTDFKNLHSFEVILEGSETPTVFIPDQTKIVNFRSNFIGSELDGSMFFADNRHSSNRKYLISMLIEPPEIVDSNVDELADIIYERRLFPYLSLNGSTDRIMQISNNIAKKSSPSISDRTDAVMKFLKNGYTYSLTQSERPNGIDPVEYFLFEEKSGTCQHFATAMVFLLRGMGIPSRVVNGYLMGDWNDIGGFFTVRQSHAHAWVEVYYPNMGWVPYDPTPSDTENDADEIGIKQFIERITTIYEGFWFNYIYSFDVNAQNFGIKKIFPGFKEKWKKFYRSPWLWGTIVFVLICSLVFSRYIYASLHYWNRKSKWVPFSYILWETNFIGFNIFRSGSETPYEFHNRLMAEGIINKETRQQLTEIENLLNDYGFNPKADKYQLITQISDKLHQISLATK